MKRPVRFAEEAAEEVVEAFRWYEARSGGLGLALIGEVDNAIDRIRESPKTHALVAQVPRSMGARRVLLERFPYAVAFIEEQTEVVVVAFAHLARRPGYWRRRLRRRSRS